MKLRPFLLVAAAVIVGMLAVSAWAWPQIPADAAVPIHWGIDGRPDGFAPKPVGLLGLPVLAVAIAALFVVIPRIEPRRDNLARSGTAYRAVASATMVLFALIHAGAVVAATGREVDVAALVAIGVGFMFAVAGNFLGKIRSNFLVGIRTPWTLTSERSWARTHRLGGRIMAALGLAIIVATLVGWRGAALFAIIGAGAAVMVVALFAYSYLVWRNDPDRRSFGDLR